MSTANTPINFKQTKLNAEICLRCNLVPFIQSSPGMGKSAMAKELADDFDLKLIDYRISSADPTDFNGFPRVDDVTGTASYVPFDTFPVDTTPLPDKLDANGKVIGKYSGWLLLMDELNHGNPSILRAAYKLILDKKIGQRNLHPCVRIMAAGNLATDNAMTNKLGSALDSRVVQYFMKNDYKEWVQYANSAKIDYRIVSFINFETDALNTFSSNTEAGPFPCERTWEFVSKMISKIPDLTSAHTDLIAGAIGSGMATKFVVYTKVFNNLPNIQDIITSPMTAKVPTAADSVYAVTGLLANYADTTNIKQILQYADRLKTEFAVITCQAAIRRTPELYHSEEMLEWINKNAELFKN
jgi:hypothetical protein